MNAPFAWGEALPVLDAPRVVLRGLGEADAPTLSEWDGPTGAR